jgi:thioredoxin reductase
MEEEPIMGEPVFEATALTKTDVLIIGAGPFGLALSARATDLGIAHVIVGKPMEFWRTNTPAGMILRSGTDWHLDVSGDATITRFLSSQGLASSDADPLSRQVYLDYCAWFQREKNIRVVPAHVLRLDWTGSAGSAFLATLDDGGTIGARRVVIALGFTYFQRVPREIASLIPAGRWTHTGELVELGVLKGKRCLIVGGRQSAFEWAALLVEAGAEAVDLSFRHDTPRFARSDWAWAGQLVDAMADDPGWFRRLSQAAKEQLAARFWAEGRLKLEPGLASRVATNSITLRPRTSIVACVELPDGVLSITLNDGETLVVDHVVFATGYAVDLNRVPFLSSGNILATLATRNGYPVLDDHFQTTIPGLFMTSMAATQDFGPFLAFTVSARTSAKLIGDALGRQHATDPGA